MTDLTLQEQQTQIKMRKISENSIVLSNIVDLTSKIIGDLAGKDIANEIEGDRLTKSVLSNMVANKLKNRIMKEVNYVK